MQYDKTPPHYVVFTVSADSHHPFKRVILIAVLNRLQLFVESRRYFSGLTVMYFVAGALIK